MKVAHLRKRAQILLIYGSALYKGRIPVWWIVPNGIESCVDAKRLREMRSFGLQSTTPGQAGQMALRYRVRPMKVASGVGARSPHNLGRTLRYSAVVWLRQTSSVAQAMPLAPIH